MDPQEYMDASKYVRLEDTQNVFSHWGFRKCMCPQRLGNLSLKSMITKLNYLIGTWFVLNCCGNIGKWYKQNKDLFPSLCRFLVNNDLSHWMWLWWSQREKKKINVMLLYFMIHWTFLLLPFIEISGGNKKECIKIS